MPSDITGTDVLEEDHATGRRVFRFVRGPLFANIVLADEINRTPPKTQAALLQAMQEYRVTAGGQTYALPLPFLVFATQNPIEQEGTYPLPEAQLDRFMFQVDVGYPIGRGGGRHRQASRRAPTGRCSQQGALARADPRRCRSWCCACRSPITSCATRWRWCGATRPTEPSAPDFVKRVRRLGRRPARVAVPDPGRQGARRSSTGASPPAIEDVRALARPMLQHRVIPNFHAEAEGVRPRAIVDRLLESVRPS